MKNFGYIILVCCFVILAGCATKTTNDNDNVTMIDIDSLRTQPPVFAFEVNRYITFEDRDDVALESYMMLEHRGDLYFVGDNRNHKVYIFDDDGKHFKTISRRGRGQGEYLKLSDFAVDDDLNVYVLCGNSQQILKYAYPDYRYESSTDIVGYPHEVYWQGDVLWAADYNKDYKNDGLVKLKDGKVSEIVLPFREVLDDASGTVYGKPRSFYPGSELLFNQRMSGDVYRLADGKAEKIFKIKSKYMVTEKNYAAYERNPNDYENICGFHNMAKNENFVVGLIWENNIPYSELFVYEPSTGRASFVKHPHGLFNLAGTAGDRFIALISQYSIIHSQNKDGLLEEIIPHITPDSNPVIVEFSVREI